MNTAIKKCECGSERIGRYRMDSDWAICSGDWRIVNPQSSYSDMDLKDFDDNERSDVDCYVCLQCYNCFN